MNSHIVHVLKVRSFLFLLLSEIFAQLAINMVNFALLTVVFDLTKSNTAVAGIVLAFTVPAIIFGFLAGVYVDRWNKKTVLLITNIFRAILLVFIALFREDLLFIYLITLLISIATQFFIPAETPMIPVLVKRKLLLPANALFGLIIYASVLIAYALSGPIIIFLGHTYVFFFLALLFLIAGIFVLFIKAKNSNVPNGNEAVENITLADEIKSTVVIMTKTRTIFHSLILLTMAQVLVLVIAVVGPGFANQVLAIRVEEFPLYFISPAALGMVMAALVLAHYFHNHPKEALINSGVFLSGVGLLVLPLAPLFASALPLSTLQITMVIAYILGVANALVTVPSNTILQEESSDAFRGKAYGTLNSLVGIFSLLPVIIAGGAADIFGVNAVITGIGVLIVLLGALRIVVK